MRQLSHSHFIAQIHRYKNKGGKFNFLFILISVTFAFNLISCSQPKQHTQQNHFLDTQSSIEYLQIKSRHEKKPYSDQNQQFREKLNYNKKGYFNQQNQCSSAMSQLFLSNPQLTVTFKTKANDETLQKVIPTLKQSSCQLIVFVFHDGQFNISIENIQNDIKIIIVQLAVLNLSFTKQPKEGKVQVLVETDLKQRDRLQITQYITIKGYKTVSKFFTGQHKMVEESSVISRQEQNQSSMSFKLIDEDEADFKEVRKVYLLRCSNEDWSYVTLPKAAIILTQIVAFIFIIILSHNIKYRRFTPLNFGFIFAITYSVILLLIVYVDDIIQAINANVNVQDLQIPKYIVAFFSLIVITIYIMDLLNFYLQQKFIIISIAFLLSLSLLIVDQIIFEDYWYINNIIAILVSGCIIKFIVIRKMKASMVPLGILWLFSIARQFIHVQSVAQEISLEIFPLHLQIPACFGDDQNGYSCSAFGSSKIIIIGLIINYSIRVDLFISSKFYQILALIAAFVSLSIQIIISFAQDQIPVMEYLSVAIFLPLSVLLMLFFANKRGQWAVVWHGSFYDMAVNRTSIRKTQSDIDKISQNFGQGLFLSATSAYSDGSLLEK